MNPGKQIIGMVALLAEQSGEQVSEARIRFLTERLAELDSDKVMVALQRLLETARRFPTLGEVRAAMGIAEPQAKDHALLLADRICEGVIKYGEILAANTARGFEQAMGPVAMALIARQGGWNACVDRAGENFGVFKAQLRVTAESMMSTQGLEVGPADTAPLPSLCTIAATGRALLLGAQQPTLALVEEDKSEVQLTVSCVGSDMIVRFGESGWNPYGPAAMSTLKLKAPVPRNFPTWKAAANWIAEFGGEHAHERLKQLVAAKRHLDPQGGAE